MKGRVFIDRFDSADHLTGKKRTYESVKAAVLKAGRFSVFEATSSAKNARLFTQLCNDPELVTDNSIGYPWTAVRLKEQPPLPSAPASAEKTS
jgi:hypothetical protein